MSVQLRRTVLASGRRDLVEALLPRFETQLRHRSRSDEGQRRQAGDD
jgi:hypothetical protein